MKTNNNPAHDAAQLAQEQEQGQKRSFFHIFRKVLRETNDGPALEPTRREWLHLTPAGRYVWSDDQSRAEDIPFSDSCRIVENLQTHGNPYRFNYGKIWQY